MAFRYWIGSFLLLSCNMLASGQLYKSSDPILQLNATNFYNTVLGQKNAFLIEFYNRWCGHCMRYASTYKEIAVDVVGWNRVLKVAALDCADDKNFEICREYQIPVFPTLKYFGPDLEKEDLGVLIDHKVENQVLRRNLIEMVKGSKAPTEWPDLYPINFSTFTKTINSIQPKTTLLILERDNSYIGQEVILDLSFLNITVLRATNSSRELLVELSHHVATNKLPILLLFQNKNIQLVVQTSNEEKARSEMTDAVYSLLHVSPVKHLPQIDESNNKIVNENVVEDKLHMVDLENTIHYLLRTEVALKETLRENTLRNFKAFLAALTKTFPATERTKAFLQQLYEWVNKQQDSIQTKEMAQFMDDMELNGISLPPLRDWLHCRGSKPTFRGYPCGLWSLFHTMTVGAHLSYLKGDMVNPGQVLLAIRDYVASFFSCSECAEHFAQMALGMETELNSPNATVLWLWNAHNKANARLAGDKTEDPAHPKVLFPTATQCPACRSDGQTWNIGPLITYLHNFYSTNIVLEKVFTSKKIYSSALHFKYFSRTDISLCLVLYISSAALLLLVYFVVLLRRRQRSRINFPV